MVIIRNNKVDYNSTEVKTCPTTNSNSGNKLRKANPVVNKHIKKKRLQLS